MLFIHMHTFAAWDQFRCVTGCVPQALQEAVAQHEHRLRNAGAIRAELQDILAWKESVAKHSHLLQERAALDAQLHAVR